jgi:hypothetical protein
LNASLIGLVLSAACSTDRSFDVSAVSIAAAVFVIAIAMVVIVSMHVLCCVLELRRAVPQPTLTYLSSLAIQVAVSRREDRDDDEDDDGKKRENVRKYNERCVNTIVCCLRSVVRCESARAYFKIKN